MAGSGREGHRHGQKGSEGPGRGKGMIVADAEPGLASSWVHALPSIVGVYGGATTAAGVARIVHPPPPRPDFYAKDAKHCSVLADMHGVEVWGDAVLPQHRPPPPGDNGLPKFLPELERALGRAA